MQAWRAKILTSFCTRMVNLNTLRSYRPQHQGRRQTFSPGGGGGGQGAGHVGADISHGRALNGCMDDNWGGEGGKARARGGGGSCPPSPARTAHVQHSLNWEQIKTVYK